MLLVDSIVAMHPASAINLPALCSSYTAARDEAAGVVRKQRALGV
jgi:hypothetical protein